MLLTHTPTDASAWGRIVLARYTSPARNEHPRLRESIIHFYAGRPCPGLAESDIYSSKTSQLEERLNGLVDLLRASGEFPTDGSRTRQSSSSQLDDEPGAYMCPTHSRFLHLLTSKGISLVTRAFSDLLQRHCKCHTHTSVMEPTCSSSLYLSSSGGGCSTPETFG